MADDNKSDKERKKRKNPWGQKSSEPVKGPWGQSGSQNGQGGGHRPGGGGDGYHHHKGGGHDGPDLDEMIRRARSNMNGMMPGGFGGGKLIALGLLILILIWLASGIYIVQPGEQAVIRRFGEWDRTKSIEGVGYHLPTPIETAQIVNVQELRRMTIGYNQALGRGGNESQIRDVPEESLMLTADRNIVDLDLVVQWNIKSAEDFLFNIEDQEGTIKKVAESAIREVVGQTQMFPIITNKRTEVADRAKDILQENLDDYNSGVNVSSVLIEKAEVHPEVQGAFQDVQSAKQDAEDIKNRAEAYREDILPRARGKAIQMTQEAQGYKESVISRATGDAERFDSVLQSYRLGEDVTKKRIYLETMENVLTNANKIILDQGESGQGAVPYLPLNELRKNNQGSSSSGNASQQQPQQQNQNQNQNNGNWN